MQTKEPYTYEAERVAMTTCDLCGAETPGTDWADRAWHTCSVDITLREGESYPEGDTITRWCVDLCPTCFKDRLVPWVLAQGGGYRTVSPYGRETVVRSELEAEFQRLAAQWREETMFHSDGGHMNAAYRKIIGMGWPVVPVLLAELQRCPDWWFVALATITGARPHSDDMAGRLDECTEAWLAWGRDRGLLSQT